MGRHFFNLELSAPNVREIDVDPAIIGELAGVAGRLRSIERAEGLVDIGGGIRLYANFPAGWKSDIVWISQSDLRSYEYFEDLFRRMRVAETVADNVDYDKSIVLYSGFFVTRTRCSSPDYHRDWVECENNAFTYLGPVSSNCGELGLVYQNARGQQGNYAYRIGKGLVFGDHFLHATAPGEARATTVLLSFTFGTDRMDKWDNIARTAAAQGMFYRQPDGKFVTRSR